MAPPAHVGAWSMAVLLGQPFEYYYLFNHVGMSEVQMSMSLDRLRLFIVVLQELHCLLKCLHTCIIKVRGHHQVSLHYTIQLLR